MPAIIASSFAFPPDETLYRMVSQANHSVHRLSVKLHYMGCNRGVGPRRG